MNRCPWCGRPYLHYDRYADVFWCSECGWDELVDEDDGYEYDDYGEFY